MKKRLTALALAASMLLVLPGCGAKTPQVPSVMPNRAEVVKASYPAQVQFPDAADYNDDWEKYNEQWELHLNGIACFHYCGFRRHGRFR